MTTTPTTAATWTTAKNIAIGDAIKLCGESGYRSTWQSRAQAEASLTAWQIITAIEKVGPSWGRDYRMTTADGTQIVVDPSSKNLVRPAVRVAG